MEADKSYPAAHAHNQRAWNEMVRNRRRFTQPIRDEDLKNPLATVDGPGWLGGDIRGKHVLCLAAGGGRQSALYAAAGAHVTVVDLSPAMLALDRQVATEYKLDVQVVETSMDQLSMFAEGQFDIVIHPVSTCYIPHIGKVYRHVARVTRDHGIYISQHKQPVSLQADTQPSAHGYEIREPYYRTGPLPEVTGSRLREEGTLEYLHRWEELLGGLCRSGFVIEDLIEPLHANDASAAGEFAHRCRYIPPYVRVKARRKPRSSAKAGQHALLWTPDRP